MIASNNEQGQRTAIRQGIAETLRDCDDGTAFIAITILHLMDKRDEDDQQIQNNS